jgi:hypothetical protein
MRWRLCGKELKERFEAFRLVFGLGAALLLAKIGFGKSIIFHIF